MSSFGPGWKFWNTDKQLLSQIIKLYGINKIAILFMRQLKQGYQKHFNKQQLRKLDISDLGHSFVVLKLIQPAREILQSNDKMNCVFRQQLRPIPHIFKCSQQLHPLGNNNHYLEFSYDPQQTINIYHRDMSLKINPFQTKNYFKTASNFEKFQQAQREKIKNVKDSLDGQQQLKFDSHFESGNLLNVQKQILYHKYHLFMQNDINTFGCTQWFFFKVSNQNRIKATFFINNFYKAQSLYKNGMKILIFSMKRFIHDEVGWVRGGQEIAYFQNKILQKREFDKKLKKFYTLKFSYHFQFQEDQVYFAYHYPYTYSRLNSYLSAKQSSSSMYYNCRTLAKTAAENKIYLITITDQNVRKQHKKSIFLTSRVHPGETVSSLMMEGVIDFLTSSSEVAAILRQRFVFKIVPMLNPDGVIHGNYRANLAGIDLNRVWDNADRLLSPEIYQLKKYIIQFNKQCPVTMFCDFHGHSAQKSAFIYGCQKEKIKFNFQKQQSRLFPFMLSFVNDDFLYKSCNFNVQKNKKGTARIQLWKQLKLPNIFTLQASFCSAQNSQYHFRPTDYSEIGVSFCKTIYQYFLNPAKKYEFIQKLKQQKELLNRNDESDSQSDTDLLDNKTLNDLKNGHKAQQILQKRKVVIQRTVTPATSLLKQQKATPKRRYTMQKNKRVARTEASPQPIGLVMSFPSKKTITACIPTKRLTLETEIGKTLQPKGYLKKSIFQRVEQNYRGKSTIYRIQRKSIKNSIIDPNKKSPSIFQLDQSLQLL